MIYTRNSRKSGTYIKRQDHNKEKTMSIPQILSCYNDRYLFLGFSGVANYTMDQ